MKEETTITFLAAECGEFHGMGECIECTSLKEAFRHYQRFCKRSPQMLPSLEFSLHHAEDPLYNEGEYPLATGEKGKELLSLLWSSIFVTLMANKIGGLQFGIYRNCQISSRVFHTAVAALPLTKANRSDFE